MTVRTRKILFWLFLFVFLVGGPGIILYISGYRIGLESGKIEKVGGAFAKTNVRNYEATLKSKYKTVHYPVTNELFVSSLTPGIYTLEIKKENFQPWQKQFSVRPSLVTSFKSIILLPTVLNPEPVLKKTQVLQSFSLSPDAKTLILPEPKTSTLSLHNVSSGELVNNIKEKNAEHIVWLANNSSFFYQKNESITSTTLFSQNKTTNIQTTFTRSLNGVRLPTKPIIKQIYAHPFETKLVVHTNVGVFAFDPVKSQSVLLTEIDPIAIAFKNSNMFFLDKTGKLYSENLVTKNVGEVAQNPLPEIQQTPSHVWELFVSGDEGKFVVQDITNKNLFLGTRGAEGFILLDKNAASPSFSADSKKMAYLKNGNPVVYWIEKDEELEKKVAQKDVLELNTQLTQLTWYKDDFHLFGHASDNTLYFFEIDVRPPLLTPTIGTEVAQYTYIPSQNVLYYLDQGNLLKLDFNFTKTLAPALGI